VAAYEWAVTVLYMGRGGSNLWHGGASTARAPYISRARVQSKTGKETS
jgi:hypothetical protein